MQIDFNSIYTRWESVNTYLQPYYNKASIQIGKFNQWSAKYIDATPSYVQNPTIGYLSLAVVTATAFNVSLCVTAIFSKLAKRLFGEERAETLSKIFCFSIILGTVSAFCNWSQPAVNPVGAGALVLTTCVVCSNIVAKLFPKTHP